MPIRTKICCIRNRNEAEIAIRCHADAIGLVSEMPSGPGVIAEEEISQITRTLPPTLDTFLLTSKQDAFEIIAQQQRCGTNVIQLVDRQTEETYLHLRGALSGIAIVQVVHVRDESTMEEALSIAATHKVDALLLDSGNPDGAVKELGGTGRLHDWSLSRRIVEGVSPLPVFLAGGLNAENVASAISEVQPFGVDVCSGVRTDGQLSEEKLARFMNAVHLI